MDDNIKSKIFDPFFSTKFTGRGLGMAAVLGIVRGHNGIIKINSKPQKGTTFKIILPAGKKYGFRAIALGFFESNKNIDLTDVDEYMEIEDEFMRVSPIEVGQVVRLNNIFFETAKATLKPESFPELDRTVEFLKNNPKIEIEVAGHTDNVGSDDYNLRLSKRRAEAVKKYFIKSGIDKKNILILASGEEDQIANNSTPAGKEINRSVEIRFIDKSRADEMGTEQIIEALFEPSIDSVAK
jgi:outer membrane protein OmpA-like peptidoglycan-associated protein